MTAGYLDVSNFNPFEANVSTATPGGENGDDQTQDKRYSSVGVPLDNPPVEINVQCPSEDESLHDGSLLWQFERTTRHFSFLLHAKSLIL